VIEARVLAYDFRAADPLEAKQRANAAAKA